ncbi:MAG: SDR family NAD(P)-dependent oxidoreductase, partial [Proteobacteria bacterium]|nr:SDR family NAD(P)-dependent oxidoreductase [Pseudomonadota bacterium]
MAHQTIQKIAFIFGLGFVGVECARLLMADGWEVRATTRTGTWDKPYASLPEGVKLFAFADVDGEALGGATHIISTIAPVTGEDIVLPLLDRYLNNKNLWAGYVSATSVYSEADGGWVRETSPTKPVSQRGKNRLRAEDAWQKEYQAEVFRAAGIYGRGRSVFDKLRGDTPRIIVKPGHFFNRIHVHDLARVIMAGLHNPSPNRIVNCADGNPCEAGDVVR